MIWCQTTVNILQLVLYGRGGIGNIERRSVGRDPVVEDIRGMLIDYENGGTELC